MKTLFALLLVVASFKSYGQEFYKISGQITEKIFFDEGGTYVKILENYDPPKSYTLSFEPGIITWEFEGKKTVYYGTKPGEKTENGYVFYCTSVRGSRIPKVMYMESFTKDRMFIYLDGKTKTATGYFLR